MSRFILSVDTFLPPTVGNLPFQKRDEALFAFETYRPRFESGELWRLVLLERSSLEEFRVVQQLVYSTEPELYFPVPPIPDQVRILSHDSDFRHFLRTYRPPLYMNGAHIIRWLCDVDSLADISENSESGER